MRLRRHKDESGLTMVELLVAMGISLITFSAVVAVLEVISRQQPRVSEHGVRVQVARNALERMTRDLRQTYSVNASSSSSLDVLTYKRTGTGQPAEQRRVIFDCSSGACSRQEGPVNGALNAAQTLITAVTNSDIFTYQPDNVNPSVLRIKFTFDVKKDSTDPAGPVTLSDGVQLRNTSTQG